MTLTASGKPAGGGTPGAPALDARGQQGLEKLDPVVASAWGGGAGSAPRPGRAAQGAACTSLTQNSLWGGFSVSPRRTVVGCLAGGSYA